jgi:hypothetical protein
MDFVVLILLGLAIPVAWTAAFFLALGARQRLTVWKRAFWRSTAVSQAWPGSEEWQYRRRRKPRHRSLFAYLSLCQNRPNRSQPRRARL